MPTPSTSPPDAVSSAAPSPREHFVRALLSLARRADEGDSTARGALARLRRTLVSRTVSFDGLREIGHALPQDLHPRDVDTYLLVAALFALTPKSSGTNNTFGMALGKLRRQLSAGAGSLDLRVAGLLDADRDDLPYRLRQLAQQLASQSISVSPYRLLDDLLSWDHPTRHVQRRWAKAYYVG